MQLPKSNSRSMRVLQALRQRPLTIYQGMEVHGVFASKAVPQGVEQDKILELYCELMDRGCLVKEGILYRLSLRCEFALQALENAAQGAAPTEIVKPPYKNPWTPEMKPGSLFKTVTAARQR